MTSIEIHGQRLFPFHPSETIIGNQPSEFRSNSLVSHPLQALGDEGLLATFGICEQTRALDCESLQRGIPWPSMLYARGLWPRYEPRDDNPEE